MVMRIQIGGGFLDVDAQTRIGFSYTGGWVDGSRADSKARTYDLSVPATPHNSGMLQFSGDPVQVGLRDSVEAVIIAGGLWLKGKLYLTGWSNDRYNLLFVYGRAAVELESRRPVFPDVITIRNKMPTTKGGAIPNFGFYSYENTAGDTDSVGVPLDRMPVVNLGYYLDTYAAASGYTVTWPRPSGWLNPYSYGLALPTCTVNEWATVAVTGAPTASIGLTATVTGGGGTLASVGLDLVGRWYRRSSFNVRVMVMVFVAVAPVRIRPVSGNVTYAAGEGYDLPAGGSIYNPGNNEFDLAVGEYFTVVLPSDAHRNIFNAWHWHAGDGYEGAVTASFDVLVNEAMPTDGMVVSLNDNLPDLTLQDALAAFCDIICGIYEVDTDTMTISVTALEDAMTQGRVDIDLNALKVSKLSQVRDYIDGLAQHNLVRCKSAEYVPEHARFSRDFPCRNAYLENEREAAVVPFNEGDYTLYDDNGTTRKLAYLDDVVIPNGSSDYEYKGVLSIICEAPAGLPALHLQTVTDDGVGVAYGRFTSEARTVEVSAVLPLYRFVKMSNRTVVHYNANNYLVRSATWADGVTSLSLLTYDGQAQPQERPRWLSLTTLSDDVITLVRRGAAPSVELEISNDGGASWEIWEEESMARKLVTQAGETWCIRNTSPVSTAFSVGYGGDDYRFSIDGFCVADGDIRSLLCKYPQAAVLSDFCFAQLFADNCPNLVTAPQMPSEMLARCCYIRMYAGTALKVSPYLPALTLAVSCYANIFEDCRDLERVDMAATDVSASYCLSGWLSNVAASGELHCDASLSLPAGSSGLPSGWVRVNI